MDAILVSPPVAFGIYVILVGLLSFAGGRMAARGVETPGKAQIYSGGEASPTRLAAPGYRPFFVVALFFAMVHLGVLVAGSGGLTPMTGLYLAGLMLALIALILG